MLPDSTRQSCCEPTMSGNAPPFSCMVNNVSPTSSPVAGSTGLRRYFAPTIPGALVKNGGKNKSLK